MFSELMAAMMGVANQRGIVAEADYLITVVFYIICTLKSTEAKFLGARFLEECTYVDEFMHEEQVGVVEEYVNFEHMKIVLDVLQKGLSHTEKYLIRQTEVSSGENSLDVSARSSVYQAVNEDEAFTK